MRAVAEENPVAQANERASQLSRGLNQALIEAELMGCAWADASMVHIILGQDVVRPDDGVTWDWQEHGGASSSLPTTPAEVIWPFRRALINHGVDLMGMGALVSCVHTESDIDATIDRFGAALSDLRRDEIL